MKAFKMWANTDEEARKIFVYMKSCGGQWPSDLDEDYTQGGYYLGSYGDEQITYSYRSDREYFNLHELEEMSIPNNKFKLVKLWGETPEEIKANYNYLQAHGYRIHPNCIVDESVFLKCKILIGYASGDIMRGYSNDCGDDATYEDFLKEEGEAIHFATPMHETGDGWYINSSGECPIAHDTLIDVRYRDGEELCNVPACATQNIPQSFRDTSEDYWRIDSSWNDIVAWRYAVTCKDNMSEKCSNISDKEVEKHSHYKKNVSHLQFIDVYRVLELYNVTNPCIQHAIKKLLVAGGRGAGKDVAQDIQEAIDSLVRWQDMKLEDEK